MKWGQTADDVLDSDAKPTVFAIDRLSEQR